MIGQCQRYRPYEIRPTQTRGGTDSAAWSVERPRAGCMTEAITAATARPNTKKPPPYIHDATSEIAAHAQKQYAIPIRPATCTSARLPVDRGDHRASTIASNPPIRISW